MRADAETFPAGDPALLEEIMGAPGPLIGVGTPDARALAAGSPCRWCSQNASVYHGGPCPKVKAVEYDEFHESSQ